MTLLLVNPPAVAPLGGQPAGVSESFFDGQKRRLRPDQYYSLPMEHLGIMSIKAYARSRGVEIETVNGMVAGHASVDETWAAMQEIARRAGPPALVGFSNIDTFQEVLSLAERCRSEWPNTRIAIGNTFGTLNYVRILREHDCFDFAVIGEGELSFTLLAEAVLNDGPIEKVPALAWRLDDGGIRTTPPTNLPLDDLPWPSRDELAAVLKAGFSGAVSTSRGCLYRCTFCGTGAASDLLGRSRYRVRSIEGVVDEIEYLMTDFGIDFISISDDLFLSKPQSMQERAAAFASEVIRRKLRIGFMFDARVDSIFDTQLLTHLKRAGLRRVFVGLETGSYEQLVSYRKRHVGRDDDPAEPIRALQALGIEVIPGTIMFHPTVAPAELRETLRLLKATGYTTPRKLIDRITAYAGTPLYHEYQAKGLLTTDWPIGEWNFAEPAAGQMYAQLADQIRSDTLTFQQAEDLFLELLEQWEQTNLQAIGQVHQHAPMA